MTQILTQAQYERLTPIERAQYWHERFNQATAAYEFCREENRILRTTLAEIQSAMLRGSERRNALDTA